jgi:hypothetical protein
VLAGVVQKAFQALERFPIIACIDRRKQKARPQETSQAKCVNYLVAGTGFEPVTFGL